jgi:hypothetical protein
VNTAQTVFALFFAIFWGAIASMQGRWLAFQPLLGYAHVRRRLAVSFAVLNVAPIVYFTAAFIHLKGARNIDTGNTPDAWIGLITAVMAAFAIFGFYRLWMAIVQSKPTAFYQREQEQPPELVAVDPSIEKLLLEHQLGGWNLLSGVLIYFGIAGIGLCLR